MVLLKTVWCVLGDFNVVIYPFEKRGVKVGHHGSTLVEYLEFEVLIKAVRLVDLSFLDERFTWFHSS